MHNSTVSAPLLECSTPLSSSKKYAAVELLTKDTIYFIIGPKARTKELYTQICAHLEKQGMLNCNLFGLAVVLDGEYVFADPEIKLSKYAPKSWRSSNGSGLDVNGSPLFVLHFRVQFYVDNLLYLRDKITRQHYYRQLRQNVLHQNLSLSAQKHLVLLGLALQADLGNFDENTHSGQYFVIHEYFPKQLIEKEHVHQYGATFHKSNYGMSREEALLQYIQHASSPDAPHSVHMYQLKSKKTEQQGTVWLGISTKGIGIYKENFCKTLTEMFPWNNIGKLSFEKKKFEIRTLVRPETKKFTFYTSSDVKSKLLLLLCRVTHQFNMAMQAHLMTSSNSELEETAKEPQNSGRNELPESGGENIYVHCPCPNLSSQQAADVKSASEVGSCHSVSSHHSRATLHSFISQLKLCEISQEGADLKQDAVQCEGEKRTTNSAKHSGGKTSSSFSLSEGRTVYDSLCSILFNGDSANIQRNNSRSISDFRGSNKSVTMTKIKSALHSTLSRTLRGHHRKVASSDSTSLKSDGWTSNKHCHQKVHSSGELDICHNCVNSCGQMRLHDASVTSQIASESNHTHCIHHHRHLSANEAANVSTCLSTSSTEIPYAVDHSVRSGEVSFHAKCGTYPSKFTVSNRLDTDSDYVQFPLDDNYVQLSSNPVISCSSSLSSSESKDLVLSLQSTSNFNELDRRKNNSDKKPVAVTSRSTSGKPSVPLTSPVREANARFITTKSHINILTAHTSVATTMTPSFTVPTVQCQEASIIAQTSTTSCAQPCNLQVGTSMVAPQNSCLSSNVGSFYPPNSSSQSLPKVSTLSSERFNDPGRMKLPNVPPIPVITRNNYIDVQASRKLSQQYCMQNSSLNHSSDLIMRPCVLHTDSSYTKASLFIPYLPNKGAINHFSSHDMYATFSSQPSLATVYTNQVTNSQIQQLKQQLYSDVDYVIYPMKEPAISKQEYIDAKRLSAIAQLNAGHRSVHPASSYEHSRKCKYKSTPDINSEVPVSSSLSPNFSSRMNPQPLLDAQLSAMQKHFSRGSSDHNIMAGFSPKSRLDGKYMSNQSLSSSHSSYPNSYSTYSLYSSTQSLMNNSSEDILHGKGARKILGSGKTHSGKSSGTEDKNADSMLGKKKSSRSGKKGSGSSEADKLHRGDGTLDIKTLQEKSKCMDLPMISALCNDRSLLNQTSFVVPHHPENYHNTKWVKGLHSMFDVKKHSSKIRPSSRHNSDKCKGASRSSDEAKDQSKPNSSQKTVLHQCLQDGKSSNQNIPVPEVKKKSKMPSFTLSGKTSYTASSCKKYPVSGLSTNKIAKTSQWRPSSTTHTHPLQHNHKSDSSSQGTMAVKKLKASPSSVT